MASQARKFYGRAGSWKRSAHAPFTFKTNQQMQICNLSTPRVPYSHHDAGYSPLDFPSRAQTLFNLLPPLLTHFPVLKACNKSPLLCQEFGPCSSYFIWAFYQVKAFSYPKKEFLVSSLKVINFPLSSYKLGYPFLGPGHLHTTLVISPPHIHLLMSIFEIHNIFFKYTSFLY